MKRQNRKAFTIVELVIVIAVIAILAAVLIPTFSSLISTAKMSSDTQLAKNMNTALSLAEAVDGKNVTFYDAMADVLEAGYTVEKLTPTSEGCHLVWDQKNDRIVFLDSNKEELYAEKSDYADSDLWFVAKTLEEATNKGYNVYLAGTALTGTVEVNSGIDVGANTGITAINYENTTGNAQNVIIRTNGGTLTVNAPADTVRHYGEGTVLTITAVASSSFHEYGKFQEAILNDADGHLVVEENGRVALLTINGGTVEAKSGSIINMYTLGNGVETTALTNNSGETVPNLTSGALEKITINGTGTQYTDFASAYEAAQTNDTIIVGKGTFVIKDNLTINKKISVVGCGEDSIIKFNNTTTYKVISVDAENVVFRDFALESISVCLWYQSKNTTEWASGGSDFIADGIKFSGYNANAGFIYAFDELPGQVLNVTDYYNKYFKLIKNVTIKNCSFELRSSGANGYKAVCFTTIDGLLIENCDFTNYGNVGKDVEKPLDFNKGVGIEINYKGCSSNLEGVPGVSGNYTNYTGDIIIRNCSFTSFGHKTGNTAGAIALKERGTGGDTGSYGPTNTHVANFTGKLVVEGCSFYNCARDICLGEGKTSETISTGTRVITNYSITDCTSTNGNVKVVKYDGVAGAIIGE